MTSTSAPRPCVAVYRSRFLPRSETFVRDHVLHMPRYDVVAVTSQLLPDSLPVPGARVVAPDRPRGLVQLETRVRRRTRGTPNAVATPALAAMLRSTGADLVHAHFGTDGAWIMGAARRARLPLVVTFHGYDATVDDQSLSTSSGGALLVAKRDELARYAAAIITVSTFLHDRLLDRGVPEEKIHVIPCGIDTAAWAPAPPAGLGAPVLFVGRLVEKKGVEDLLHAMTAVPDAPPLFVAGDGPLRPSLEALAAELGVRTQFLGVQTSDQVADLMAEAALVAMPSKTARNGDSEGLPVTAIEAASRGRAVVGYRHSGLVDAVASGRTGLLVAEGDVDSLGRGLAQLLADHQLRQRLAAAGPAHVEAHFTRQDTLSRVADVYDSVLRQEPGPMAPGGAQHG